MMRMKSWQQTILLLFFSLAPLWGQSSGKIDALSLYEKDLVILGEGRKGPYLLPDSLLIRGSERVFIDGNLLVEQEYQLDYINGEIRFREVVPQGASIRLIYKLFPVSLKKSYSHRPLLQRVFGAPTSPADQSARPSKAGIEDDFASQLTKSGSITRGVTVGSNRGLKVNSSLNFNVSGKVAENVEVVAALTDQSTPIQPEGTTQNLQEIDKVFVQIKAPNLSATMGDYNLDFTGSQFAGYSRKLQGAMGKAEYRNWSGEVSGAVSRGKYFSLQISGQEGNQGPYQLKGDRGQIDIIVLAGTERVYVDGEQMVRGETNDYIIDYSAAQITFTRRRLITADSRIVVDFQYSDEKYRRNLYAARTQARLWDGKLKIGSALIREADDKNNPLDFTLSEEYLQALRQAGDDQQKAIIDGASFVGPGKGRYLKDPLTEAYVYAGTDSGEYLVSFSDVGEGSGAYRYKGAGIYEYIGENQGRYAPVILLSPAHSQDLFDLEMEFAPHPALNLRGEMAMSSLDANTYSTLDDGDNNGVAHDWQLTIKPDSLRFFGNNLGRIQLAGRLRQIQNRFQDIDRTTEVEYNRRWDLPDTGQRGETVQELTGRYEPFRGMSFGGEIGTIKKGETFNSDRWQVESKLSRRGMPEYDYRIERIQKNMPAENRTGDWLRQRGHAAYLLWKLRPSFDYEGELKKENWSDSLFTGFRFDNFSGGLEFQPSSKLTASAKVSYRDDKDYAARDRFVDKSTAATQNLGLRLQQLGSFSGSMAFTHRERKFTDPTVENKTTDLAEIQANFSPWKRALSADLNYQISNTATAKKERVYIKVSQGDGNYRFDEQLNEYVNDALGDYVLRILTTDELVPVVELKSSGRLRLEPGKLWNVKKQSKKPGLWRRAVTALSSESYAAIEERTQEKDVWQIYLLNLSQFRQPGTTILGSLQIRQDVFLFEHDRDLSLRLRSQTRDEINDQYLEGGQDRIERENSARVTAQLTNRLSTQTELTRKRTARTFAFAGRQNRNIYATQANIDLSFRPKAPLEIALESRLSWEEDRVYEIPTQVRAYALTPRVNYSLQSRGRLHGELEWSTVKAEPADRVIPYEMANGRSIGSSMRWDVRFDYRVSPTIQASFSYSGRNEPERGQTIHTGRAQVTAAFR
jgi:hypothetical protein